MGVHPGVGSVPLLREQPVVTPVRPEDQFQIGDNVTYVREGVHSQVQGYMWAESVGGAPTVIGYKLSCGISVPRAELVRRQPPPTNPA